MGELSTEAVSVCPAPFA